MEIDLLGGRAGDLDFVASCGELEGSFGGDCPQSHDSTRGKESSDIQTRLGVEPNIVLRPFLKPRWKEK